MQDQVDDLTTRLAAAAAADFKLPYYNAEPGSWQRCEAFERVVATYSPCETTWNDPGRLRRTRNVSEPCLLELVAGELEKSPHINVDFSGARVFARHDDVCWVFWHADNSKALMARVENGSVETMQALSAVQRVDLRQIGIEISWRAIEDACAVIRDHAKPEARKRHRIAAAVREALRVAHEQEKQSEATELAKHSMFALIRDVTGGGESGDSRCFGPVLAKNSFYGVHGFELHFSFDDAIVAAVKSIEGARYLPEEKVWFVPHTCFEGLVRFLKAVRNHRVGEREGRLAA